MTAVESVPAHVARLIPAHPFLVRLARSAWLSLGPLALLLSVSAVHAQVAPPDSARRPPADTAAARARADSLARAALRARADSIARGLRGPDTAGADSVQADSSLNVQLLGRLEFKGEQTRNDRCFSNQLFSATFSCNARLTPQLDFQFGLLSGGVVADRVRVNVDYDSQREFDGSNNISIAYQGQGGELLQRIEIGNVSFQVPASRFITSGIPAGNYGIQLAGKSGRLSFAAIAATQKGNVVSGQTFMVGARTAQSVTTEILDYRVEPRRFFFTIDPELFGARYPNIDILDPRLMGDLAAGLSEDVSDEQKVHELRIILLQWGCGFHHRAVPGSAE